MKKVKAGLILLSAKWFLDAGLQNNNSGDYRKLTEFLKSDTESVIETLSRHFEIFYPGPMYSDEEVENVSKALKDQEVKVIILVHLMWSEDRPLVEILKRNADLPILLWCYNPYRMLPDKMSTIELFRSSGTVGMLQGSAPMHRMGKNFSIVFGSPGDQKLDKELKDMAAVYEASENIKKLRIGQIATRCELMTGTYVDEFRLVSSLGPRLIPISAYRLYERASSLTEEEVYEFIGNLKKKYKVKGVSDHALFFAARASLAVERLADEEGLGAVAIEDLNPELHRLLKTRPCLWTPGLRDKKIVIGMEADVISTMGMWIGRQLGGSTPMYTEIFTYDESENALLMGHAAMHDIELAGDNEITLIPDYEYAVADEVEGAWLHFTGKPGPVTVISLFADVGKYRMLVFEGQSLPIKDKLAGFSNVMVKIDIPLDVFFEKLVRMGMTQHFAVSFDCSRERLKKFCQVAGIEYVEL